MNKVHLVQGPNATFDAILSTVKKAASFVKPTFGPSSNKVLISKQTHRLAVDDGVQILRDLELPDAVENAILKEVRETSIKTNDRAGDGTTGSFIVLEAIIKAVSDLTSRDGRKIEKELKKGLEDAKKQLLALAKPVKTKAELEKVARISFDDQKIAGLISDTMFKLGKDGVLTVDRSGTMETFVELTDGVKIANGYVSPYMVTNPQRMEGVIEKPYIMLTDYRLTEAADIIGVMNKLAEKNIRNLVLICEHIEGAALATAIVNKVQGQFNLIAVNAPTSEGDRSVFLEDIALLTGAKLFSEKKGDKLEEAELDDLGRAGRFIAKKTESVIVSPKTKKSVIASATKALRAAIKAAPGEREKTELKTRLARFSNKVAVIKVGAATENEEKALRYKVEDAINAVQCAFRGGVVAGGGFALASLETSSPLLNEALKRPHMQLAENVGLDAIPGASVKKGIAYNVVTNEAGDFRKVGVMDPVEVLLAAVESAVSIACVLVTMKGIIVEEPPKPKTE